MTENVKHPVPDAMIIAGAHGQFRKMPAGAIRVLINECPVIVDVRGMLAQDSRPLEEGYYWFL